MIINSLSDVLILRNFFSYQSIPASLRSTIGSLPLRETLSAPLCSPRLVYSFALLFVCLAISRPIVILSSHSLRRSTDDHFRALRKALRKFDFQKNLSTAKTAKINTGTTDCYRKKPVL